MTWHSECFLLLWVHHITAVHSHQCYKFVIFINIHWKIWLWLNLSKTNACEGAMQISTLKWHQSENKSCFLSLHSEAYTSIGDSDIIALDRQLNSKINLSKMSILPLHTVLFLFFFPLYCTLSVQFTACLHLTKSQPWTAKIKGTNLIFYLYGGGVCKTLILLRWNTLCCQKVLAEKHQSFTRLYRYPSMSQVMCQS